MRRWWRRSLPVLGLALAAALAAQVPQTLPQAVTAARALAYEEETPPNLSRLELRRAEGVARDRSSSPIPAVTIGLFSDDGGGHKLLAALTTGQDGKFDFGDKIPDGNYRLIAKYPGLCTANIPIAVRKHARHHHRLELRMEYPGLDVCSYATAQ